MERLLWEGVLERWVQWQKVHVVHHNVVTASLLSLSRVRKTKQNET